MSVGTSVALRREQTAKEEIDLSKNILTCATLLAASVFLAGCAQTQEAANPNATASPVVATTTTRPGPDNSEITTTTDANGVTTETRVFRDSPRVARVVVTTHNGTRTTRVYSRTGEEKELKDAESESVLDKTGDAIANSAGFVADKTVEGTKKGVEVGKDVGEKTADTAKTVGEKTADVSKKVGNKAADTAKTVGEKTAEGAKKTGKAIKKVVKP
jgi:ABC-type Fe3+-hydroxamate transport system substrate-binding protein